MHDGIRRKGAHQNILSSLSCRRNGLAHSVFTDSPPESRVYVTEKHSQSRHMQVRLQVIDATRVCRGVYLTVRQSRRVRTQGRGAKVVLTSATKSGDSIIVQRAIPQSFSTGLARLIVETSHS